MSERRGPSDFVSKIIFNIYSVISITCHPVTVMNLSPLTFFICICIHGVKAHATISIKQSPVLKGHPFRVLSLKIHMN